MKLHHVIPCAIATFALAGSLFAAPETFKIDPKHSSVNFKIGHLGVSNVHGRFNTFEGGFTQDKENDANNEFHMTVDTASLDTGIEARDKHVTSPDLLNVKQYPEMTFKSDSVKKLSDNEFEIKGSLTLHGVTKPVTAKLHKIGEATDEKGVHRAGGESTFTIKRSDFGMTGMQGALGDEVTVTIAVEAIREKAANDNATTATATTN